MTTKFPAQIDSFAIHVPQEIIRAQHVNDLQEATVAIEVFCKSLQEALNNHIHQTSNVYAASAIGLDTPINGSTNVFTALQDINTRFAGHVNQTTGAHAASAISVNPIPSLSGTNVQDALANLQAQLNNLGVIESSSNVPNTLVLRDGSGNFAAGTITASFAGNVTGNVTGNVSGSAATFTGSLSGDVTGTQSATVVSTVGTSSAANVHTAELLANASTSSNTASTIVKRDSSGNFSAGTITATLSGNATTASTATNVALNALLGADSYVVGTNSTQVLQKKTIISDFDGSKIVLFTSAVTDQEKVVYDSYSASANQLEVRQKAVSTITAVNQGLAQVTVPDASFFSNVVGVTGGVQFLIPSSTTLAPSKVISILGGNVLQLDSVNVLVDTTANANWVLVNKVKATPLFYVDTNGAVYANELTVANSTFNNISLDDDVNIVGKLTVSGLTTLSSGLAVTGNFSASGTSTVGLLNTGSVITTGSTTISGTASVGSDLSATGKLSVGNNATFSKDVVVIGNEIVDGYLSVGSNGSFGGGLTVTNVITSGNGLFTSGALTATLPSTFKSDLEVDGNFHTKGNAQIDGYLNVTGATVLGSDLTINGNLLITGSTLTTPSVFTIANGQASPTDVTGLTLSASTRGIFVEYTIYRYFTSPTTELSSVGTLRVVSKNHPQSWQLDDTYAGDNVGVTFSVTSAGHVQYTSTTITGTQNSSLMKFRTRSFDV